MRRMLLFVVVVALWPRAGAAAPTVDGVVDGEYGSPVASDPAGDYATSAERKSQWDLVDLYLTHDASDLYVAFSLAGSVDDNASEEKSYILYIDTTGDSAGASTDAWQRRISVSDPHKPEYSVNSWAFGSGAYGLGNVELRRWAGSAWDPSPAQIAGAAARSDGGKTVFEWKISRAAIGDPQQIWVEVLSTGTFPTDNAQDTVNAPADDWNAPTGSDQWTAAATVSNSTHYVLLTVPDAGVDSTVDAGSVDLGVDAARDVGALDATVDSQRIDTAAIDSAVDTTRRDASVDLRPRDGGVDRASDDLGAPDRPAQGDASAGGGDEGGCGCAAKGEGVAQASLPLVLAFGFIGRRRRRS